MEASASAAASRAPIWGELRYSGELVRLLADGELRAPRRRSDAPPVLLIPGFMAGDASLGLLRHWLRRRGHRVAMSGMRANVDCAERIVSRLGRQLRAFASDCGPHWAPPAFVEWEGYAPLWRQLAGWAARRPIT